MTDKIPLGQYLFERIAQLGVRHVLGCPGDFNLTLLDHVYSVKDLKWIGCCNELNAAYAADGYARIRGLPAALVTTYGVGELSAMNGIAGAMAEHAPILHIVGTTARITQDYRVMIHHTFKENPDHTVYQKMAEPIRCATTFLDDEETAAEEIDRVIRECYQKCLPAYIYIPMDVTESDLDATRLKKPLPLEIANPASQESEVVESVLKAIYESKSPAILGDVLGMRHRAIKETRQLVEVTQFPSYTTFLGKGLIDETNPRFAGLYNGKFSWPGIQSALESSDLVLNIGPWLTDSNTGGFTREIEDKNLIKLHPDYCVVRGKTYDGVHFLPVLRKVLDQLDASKLPSVSMPSIPDPPAPSTGTNISQDWVWRRISDYLQKDDILLVETGTAQFGIVDGKFPENLQFITQVYWSCIGFTLPATLGALIANKEMNGKGRVILIEGDGSLHMTFQEIGTMVRYGFKPTIFVINNNGYTIERAIHGPKQDYNDISPLWDYQAMLKFFGARDSYSTKVSTRAELEKVLKDPSFIASGKPQVCEVMMGTFDEPWRLTAQVSHVLGKMKDTFRLYAEGRSRKRAQLLAMGVKN